MCCVLAREDAVSCCSDTYDEEGADGGEEGSGQETCQEKGRGEEATGKEKGYGEEATGEEEGRGEEAIGEEEGCGEEATGEEDVQQAQEGPSEIPKSLILMPVQSRVGFVKEFLGELFDQEYREKKLSSEEYFPLVEKFLKDRPALLRISRDLFANVGQEIDTKELGPLKLVMLRELDGKDFPFILIPIEPLTRRPLVCFVGCRFAAGIDRTLEFNLRTVLDPWEIDVHLEGRDLASGPLLQRILRRIRAADMCIFDNLGTHDRPNVYIEAGMSMASERPIILCEFTGSQVSGLQAVPATAAMPSDFRGLTRLRYKRYRQLFRDLYLRMPQFLSSNRLR